MSRTSNAATASRSTNERDAVSNYTIPDVTGLPVFQAMAVLDATLECTSGSVTVTVNGTPIDASVASDHRLVTEQTPNYTGTAIECATIALTARQVDPDYREIRMPGLVGLMATPAVAALAALRSICIALNSGEDFDVEVLDTNGDPVPAPYQPDDKVTSSTPAEDGPVRPGDTVAVILVGVGDDERN